MENKNPQIKPVIEEEADFVAKTKKYRKELIGLFVAGSS